MSFHVPEKYRITTGLIGSDARYGNNGAFWVPIRSKKPVPPLRVIASDGLGWDHVSVSLIDRCPTWVEMCLVKNLFLDEDDCVMQLHPPKNNYVNNHSFCLHLWRPWDVEIPQPPDFMVGIKELGTLTRSAA